MKFKLIIFDLDNTIFDYDKAEAYALDKTFEHFGIVSTEALKISYRMINERTWKRFEQGEITSEELRILRFVDFGDLHGFSWDPAEVSRIYLGYLGMGSFLINGAEELISSIVNDFRLASVTNGISDVQRSRLANSSFHNIFNPVIVSDEVGVAKPDPEIFRILLEGTEGFSKDDILMVGDSLSSDISGAAAFGIQTCWYNPYGKEVENGAEPDYIIRELSELKAIIY